MKYKNLVVFLLLVCIAATLIGAVSAQEVVVLGEKFNIPDGLHKDEDYSEVIKNSNLTDEYLGFYNDTDYLSILVSSYSSGQLSFGSEINGCDQMTVNGILGYYRFNETDGFEGFLYSANGKLIYVEEYGENILFEDVVVND